MTNKTMPTNINAIPNEYDACTGDYDTQPLDGTTEYTIVHNNPDYHVIKKSDVDGDVMGAFGWLVRCLPDNLKWRFNGEIETIRNALIAQSDPDIVGIPRKVLERMLNKFDGASESPECACVNCRFKAGQNQAINDVLNYKEGDDA